ncbi:MAG: selenosugar synthase SenB [Betaproteobacteria bacterium]|nr:selenosugar synthase SenB [Betaproteobacteria bacterium]MDH3435900.1 selenosugar synthase SenB [Betaproteobacteria bacterium]
MKIAITVPPSAVPRSGNRHTAARWCAFLRSLGHRVGVGTDWNGGEDDMLLALHAYKSYPSIARFRQQRPDAPLVLALTGTDLYRDIREQAEARQALKLATRLIVLQEEGLNELTSALRKKAMVVYQSSDVRLRHAPAKGGFRVAVIGHLRGEKDPFRAARALAHIAPSAPIELLQIGDALDPAMRAECESWEKRDPRYRWLGSLPHATAMRRLSTCHLLVVSSVMEGGANVICEAARIGVPVLASRIQGNVGMLGRDYPGYFPLFDDKSLARLIERCRADARFYASLKKAVLRRRALFAPSAERAALKVSLRDLPSDGRRT